MRISAKGGRWLKSTPAAGGADAFAAHPHHATHLLLQLLCHWLEAFDKRALCVAQQPAFVIRVGPKLH
jgi:hypothetical protein